MEILAVASAGVQRAIDVRQLRRLVRSVSRPVVELMLQVSPVLFVLAENVWAVLLASLCRATLSVCQNAPPTPIAKMAVLADNWEALCLCVSVRAILSVRTVLPAMTASLVGIDLVCVHKRTTQRVSAKKALSVVRRVDTITVCLDQHNNLVTNAITRQRVVRLVTCVPRPKGGMLSVFENVGVTQTVFLREELVLALEAPLFVLATRQHALKVIPAKRSPVGIRSVFEGAVRPMQAVLAVWYVWVESVSPRRSLSVRKIQIVPKGSFVSGTNV